MYARLTMILPLARHTSSVCLLALSLGLPTLAHAGSPPAGQSNLIKVELPTQPTEPEQSAVPIRVVIKASLDKNTEYFERELGERITVLLEDAGHETTTDAGEAEVTVRLRVRYFEDDRYSLDFVVDTDVQTGDQVRTLETLHCGECNDDTFFERMADYSQETLLGAVDDAVERARSERPVPVEGEPDGPRPDLPARIGALGYTGAGVALAGVGVTIAGAVLWGRGEEIEIAGVDTHSEDHRPTGKLLVGVGIGVAAIGAVMLGVDMGIRAKKRGRAERLTLIPTFGPDHAGLVFQGRF